MALDIFLGAIEQKHLGDNSCRRVAIHVAFGMGLDWLSIFQTLGKLMPIQRHP